MNLFDRAARWWLERRYLTGPTSPRDPAYWLVDMYGGPPSSSGVRITPDTALTWTALASAVQFLTQAMASMPLELRRKRATRGSDPADELLLYRLLHDQPNQEMTSYEWRELSEMHLCLWGNAYSYITWSAGNQPLELTPLNPDRVQLKRDDAGTLYYQVSIPQNALDYNADMPYRRIETEDMLHIRGPSRYGLLGESIARLHPDAIGLGLVSEQFASRFFGSGLHPSGVLEHPAKLSEQAKERLRKSLDKQAGGLSQSHKTLVLEEGMKWNATTIEPEKAQFLGLREFQVQEASRILRVPPHLIYDLSRATFSNIEHQGIEVVMYTLMPRVVRWEQRLNMQLISTKMQSTLYTHFNMNAFLRGDTLSRHQAYQIGRLGGWLSPNDIRDLEDMNPIPKGDSYLEPANTRPLGSEPADVPVEPKPSSNGGNRVQVAA